MYRKMLMSYGSLFPFFLGKNSWQRAKLESCPVIFKSTNQFDTIKITNTKLINFLDYFISSCKIIIIIFKIFRIVIS